MNHRNIFTVRKLMYTKGVTTITNNNLYLYLCEYSVVGVLLSHSTFN